MPRKGYLTASQFAAALGMNPYLSRAALFRQLRGIDPPFAGNEYTEHGNRTEPVALAAYEALTGFLVDGRQSWFEKRHYGTHIDGIAIDAEGGKILTEVKCPVNGLYSEPPSYYLPQVLGQQWLAGIERTHFVAYHEGDLAIWLVKFNEQVWRELESAIDKFWEDTMAGREPPHRKSRLPDLSKILHIERLEHGEAV